MALRRAAGLAPEDGLLWSEHPLGRKLLQRVMEYHGSKGDVETLASVGCVLRSHACAEADSQAAGHDHGTPELPPSKADTRALARGKALQAGDSDPPPAAAAATSAMTSAKSSTTSLSSGSGSDAGAKSPTLSLSPRQRRWMQLSGDTAAVATPATQRKVCTRKSLAFDHSCLTLFLPHAPANPAAATTLWYACGYGAGELCHARWQGQHATALPQYRAICSAPSSVPNQLAEPWWWRWRKLGPVGYAALCDLSQPCRTERWRATSCRQHRKRRELGVSPRSVRVKRVVPLHHRS